MPIYEYQCAACGQIVEKWQKFSDAPLTVCPHCGDSLNKVISSCAFHLKGGGWYVTDYAGSRSNSSAAEKPKESGESAASSGKTEAPASSKFK